MTNKIEAVETTIAELKTESRNGKDSVHDLVTAVKTLSTRVEEQHTTIRGLITGKVDLKDTTGIQQKIKEVMEEHSKSLVGHSCQTSRKKRKCHTEQMQRHLHSR